MLRAYHVFSTVHAFVNGIHCQSSSFPPSTNTDILVHHDHQNKDKSKKHANNAMNILIFEWLNGPGSCMSA